jgi:flagellar FliJ protein
MIALRSYHFKMEKVLEYKNRVEKSIIEDYAKINTHLSKEKEHLENLKDQYEKKGHNSKTATDLKNMKMQFLYKEKLKSEMTYQERKVARINTKLDEVRGDLVEARKDRKIMENLKEKDKIRYDKELKDIEQKELDDLTIMKYGR